MDYKNKIIIALDGLSEKEAIRFAALLKGKVWGFKVNDLLFRNADIIRRLKKFGGVFADAKLHDIPNTVAHSVRILSQAGADMITVHASGGAEMMRAAKQNAGSSKILAVMVVTSLKADSKKVIQMAREVLRAHMDGIVCSGHDLLCIKHIAGTASLLKIVPGIRPRWYMMKDDQKRVMTSEKAIKLGADYLVIGRPILSAKNPVRALASM